MKKKNGSFDNIVVHFPDAENAVMLNDYFSSIVENYHNTLLLIVSSGFLSNTVHLTRN